MFNVTPTTQSAVLDFRRARRWANLEEMMARLTGKSSDLLSYDDVRQKLRARGGTSRGLQDIALDAIVGSVGRYTDFTRSFLPRQSTNSRRWANVKQATTDATGVPPIEVYQIDSVYFVLDGNHRVSVARQLKAKTIQAYVTEVYTKVPLTPDDQPDDLILKTQYAEFLEEIRLDKLRPDADLTTTAPGNYDLLLEQIDAHRRTMIAEEGREMPASTAVCHWYDEVYLPIVQIMREQAILREFPGRTETDLYVWLIKHTDALQEELGWEIEHRKIVSRLATEISPTQRRVAARVRARVVDALTPDPLESGPPVGEWRKEQTTARRDERLTSDILVPINGNADGWAALDQATAVAQREEARLRGLYVVASTPQIDSPKSQAVRDEFMRRCEMVGIEGELAIESGGIARTICERARWTDLVVVNLSRPPGLRPIARLRSGFRTMLLRCSTPVLVVPGIVSSIDRALLAYDGSPKADEALFLATYLAEQWSIPLVVVTVDDHEAIGSEALDSAQQYLNRHNVITTIEEKSGPVADAIFETANAHRSNLIVMGGYGFNAVLQAVLGSTVDQVLRNARQPVLVCR
ncbi:universal stress protein [Chloroflexi bacterium TSY]|nr:universal stress protein [Chloroflexi bacterium TSY]